MKNIMKNLAIKFGNDWILFIKNLYKCFGKIDISEFLSDWKVLKTTYPSATTYLLYMKKIKEK